MNLNWTRRQFSQLLAASAASALFSQRARAAVPKGFAHIASPDAGGVIHTFRVSGPDWRPLQSLPSPHPAHLEPHPTLPILYAVHSVSLWDRLPRGAVSAYTLHPTTGHLSHLDTQPLSLAATRPCHATVSPDGTSLAVASQDTGIYNILALASDGTLSPPAIIRKELGPLSTRCLQFLPDSRTLITTGSHGQFINAFTIEGEFLIPVAPEAARSFVSPLKPDSKTRIPSSLVTRIDAVTSLLFRPA